MSSGKVFANTRCYSVSDIQKVKAVFKPELASLTDVVVFPTTGNVALADKLSGGDYDGDTAWVCWDPNIVQNFESAEVPVTPDLFREGFFRKEAHTFQDLLAEHGDDATNMFFDKSLRFNLEPKLLGLATKYKERLCYHSGSVGDESAVYLSTAVSHLVDQAKQGIAFTNKDWARLRKRVAGHNRVLANPAYEYNQWTRDYQPSHIIDYLKFSVAIPLIDRELASFDKSFNGSIKPEFWDKDLTRLFDLYDKKRCEKTRRKPVLRPLLEQLDRDLEILREDWSNHAKWKDVSWEARITHLFEKFCSISPKVTSSLAKLMMAEDGQDGCHYSTWALLKASTLFKKYCNNTSAHFVWSVAGIQLQWLKATARGRHVAAVTPRLYAALRPNPKYIQAVSAQQEGLMSEITSDDDEDEWDDDT
jgi:hypothetical protein